MAIPKFDELLHPVLELATKQDITRKSATAAMADLKELTEEERNVRLPSGSSTYINNRTGWAMTFLTKGALIEKVAKYTYRATPAGRNFLQAHPTTIRESDLQQLDGWEEAWAKGSQRRAEAKKKREGNEKPERDDKSLTPAERLELASESLDQALREELLEQLTEMDPYRFEHVVIDLLSAMGYGGSREEAAKVTKASNDEGIDGLINEDRLGLDVVYVQAKRWKGSIGRGEIQSFVGALAGKQAHKGVFITTSDFGNSAVEYAKTVSQKVILIGGERLCELMIEHNVGVTTVHTVSVKRIDSDYFEDD